MTREQVPPLAPFEQSPITRALVDRLRDVEVDAVVTYDDLSSIVGEDVRNSWHLVRSARETLLKERIAFGVIPNMGLKRLNDSGKLALSESYMDKVKHSARRSVRVLRATDLTALSDPEKQRYRVTEVRAGVALQFASKRVGGALGRAISAGQEPRALKGMLDASVKQFEGAKTA